MLQSSVQPHVNTGVTGRLAGDPLQGVRWSLAAKGHVCEYATGITNEQLCHAFPIFLMGLGSLQSYEKHYPPINSKGESPIQVERRNLRQTPTYMSTQTHIYWCLYKYVASYFRQMPKHPTFNVYVTVLHLLVFLQRFLSFFLRGEYRYQKMMLFKK